MSKSEVRNVSVSAISRILSGEGLKKARPKGWSTGFYLTEFYGYVEVGYQTTDDEERQSMLKGIALTLNQRPQYTAELIDVDDEFHTGTYVFVRMVGAPVVPQTSLEALTELRHALDELRENFYHTRLNAGDMRLQVLYLVPFKDKVRVAHVTFNEAAQKFVVQRTTEAFETVDEVVGRLYTELVH